MAVVDRHVKLLCHEQDKALEEELGELECVTMESMDMTSRSPDDEDDSGGDERDDSRPPMKTPLAKTRQTRYESGKVSG